MYKKVQRQLHKQMKRMSKFFSRGPELTERRAFLSSRPRPSGLPFVAIILGCILVGLAFQSYFAPAPWAVWLSGYPSCRDSSFYPQLCW